MANLCSFCFLLLFCPFLTWAEDDKGRVLELTDATFDAAIAKHDHILVDFYAPWCGHCKKLSPELDAAAPGLAEKTPPIFLAKLNADKYTKVASKYDVSAYPTLKLFINGFPIDYKGPRKAASLSSHLQKLVSPDVKVLGNEVEVQDFMQNADDSFPFFVGFGVERSAISELAKQHKSRAWFLVLESFSERAMESFDFDKSPALVVLRLSQGEQEVYYGPFEGDDLAQFVQQNLLPRVNLLMTESMRSLREDGRPIALAILRDDSSEQSVSFIKKLKAAAPANRAFVFAYTDTLKWPSFTTTFHIDEQSKVPVFIVWDGDSTYFVSAEGYDFGGERAEAYITFFLQEFKEGKAKKLNVKGPSFMEFVRSLISMKSVYILFFIVGVIIFAQNIWGSDMGDIRKKQWEQIDSNDGMDKQRSPSKYSSSENSLNASHTMVKED